MNLDGTSSTDVTPIVTDLLSLTRNKTDFERENIYWELWFTYREKNPQRHCDSSNIELCQDTKPSEQTPGNSTVYPVIENSETKTLNDTCDKPVITSNTINQDGHVANDAAYRTVPPVVENSETQILNNTCDKPVITNQDGNIANEARSYINSNTTSGQYLDFLAGVHIQTQDQIILKDKKRTLLEPRSLSSPD